MPFSKPWHFKTLMSRMGGSTNRSKFPEFFVLSTKHNIWYCGGNCQHIHGLAGNMLPLTGCLLSVGFRRKSSVPALKSVETLKVHFRWILLMVFFRFLLASALQHLEHLPFKLHSWQFFWLYLKDNTLYYLHDSMPQTSHYRHLCGFCNFGL